MIPDKKNLLVTLADANFVKQAKQLFASVYFNAGWEGDYLLIANGISEEDLDWFRNKGILVYDAPLLDNLRQGEKTYPPIVLSKFYLFQEYFKKWQKIIFLDADIIVRRPLDYLLGLPGFSAAQAVSFRLKDEFIDDNERIKEIREKYDLNGPALATGVLVIDSDLIAVNTFNEIVALYERFKDVYQYSEESTLNLYFYKNWTPLPTIYNSMPNYMRRIYGIKKNNLLAIVLHFVCEKIKPWEEGNLYYPEWSENFKKADMIDLFKRPKGLLMYSKCRLLRYNLYLKFKEKMSFTRRIYFFVDRQIGRVGLYLKKNYPPIYSRLIKVKIKIKSRYS